MKSTQFAVLAKKLTNIVKRSLNRHRHSFLSVPGMMGYAERMNLYLTCQRELTGKGAAVEFGAFLGASTAAIQKGLRANPHLPDDIPLHVIDCFRTPLASDFSEYVRDYSHRGHVEHLLVEEDEWLCFYKAFLAHIDEHDRWIKIHRCFVSEFTWEHVPVEFLHLDLPKDWGQASYIVSQVFPDLVVGAKVLLQDFGYQWSAELIAMTGHMVATGHISPYRLTDTTLSARVEKSFTNESIETIQSLMATTSGVLAGIDIAHRACQELITDRVDVTLLMAKAQYLYSSGDEESCFKILSSILPTLVKDQATLGRLTELLRSGFVVEKSFEIPVVDKRIKKGA